MRPRPETIEEVLKRWPRLTSHLICTSLGYATPTRAASIILDAINDRENWCEWIFSCYDKDPKPALRGAIERRHHHEGYMADYRQALAIVRHVNDGGKEPEFASWF